MSIDGARSWRSATLGSDLGRLSFSEWHLPVTFKRNGPATVMVRATNRQGEVQPMTADWNPGGYRRRVVETTSITIV